MESGPGLGRARNHTPLWGLRALRGRQSAEPGPGPLSRPCGCAGGSHPHVLVFQANNDILAFLSGMPVTRNTKYLDLKSSVSQDHPQRAPGPSLPLLGSPEQTACRRPLRRQLHLLRCGSRLGSPSSPLPPSLDLGSSGNPKPGSNGTQHWSKWQTEAECKPPDRHKKDVRNLKKEKNALAGALL